MLVTYKLPKSKDFVLSIRESSEANNRGGDGDDKQ
jgi:hypothetical protein